MPGYWRIDGPPADAAQCIPERHLSQHLAQLGVGERELKTPGVVFVDYVEYVSDHHFRTLQKPAVYVMIALSPTLSPDQGLPKFLPTTNRVPIADKGEPVSITLKMGWALIYTSRLAFQRSSGWGGEYVALIYTVGDNPKPSTGSLEA
jgi:hypothetical protein